MYRLVPSLVHEMGDTYHELQRAQPLITETLLLEEQRFKKDARERAWVCSARRQPN